MADEDTTAATKAPPALFEHCVQTYRTMLREAKLVNTAGNALEDADEGELVEIELSGRPDGQIIVYEGFFTRLIQVQLNLSVPYYTSITKALRDMGCVRQLKRGGGTSPSQWELIQEPTLEAFNNAQPKKTRKPSKDAQVQEQLDNFNGRLTEVEDKVNDILEALAAQFGTTSPDEGTN